MELKDLESMGVEELRAALCASNRARDEALRREGELRSKDTQPDVDDPSTAPVCYFFDKAPREVRDRIYKYLLVDFDLSTTKFLSRWGPEEERKISETMRTAKYELSPQILRVCRQALDEALPILYESNTFIVDFATNESWPDSLIFNTCSKENCDMLMNEASGLYGRAWVKRATRWKVILTTNKDDRSEARDKPFTYFCQFLSSNTPRSLKVYLLPRGPTVHQGLPAHTNGPYHDIKEVLQPLKLLRNVPTLRLDEARSSDLPTYSTWQDNPSLAYGNISPILREVVEETVKGNTPIEYVWKMYAQLVDYATAFERNNTFRGNMKPRWGEARRNLANRGQPTYPESNPFKTAPIHPVEENIEKASISSEENDAAVFKQARKVVVDYLEPQYRRIAQASAAMAEFVKANKSSFIHLYPDFSSFGDPTKELLAACMVFLEEYAASFVRDIPMSTRLTIRQNQRHFNFLYESMEREVLVKKLSEVVLDMEQHMVNELPWKTWFMTAVDDMDKQYLEIRKARKELFDFDRADDEAYGCDIDLELWKCDEMIDWTVDEPKLEPYDLPNGLSSLRSIRRMSPEQTQAMITWACSATTRYT